MTMPHGSYSLGETAAKQGGARLVCECGRRGQYRIDRLLEQYGPDIAMPDLRDELAQCPHRRDMSNRVRSSTLIDWGAMRHPKIDRIRATRRFGGFAVLTLAIEKIRAGRMTASEAAKHFEQVAHSLRETGHYDPKLVDMLIGRLRQTRKEEGRTCAEEGE
jgi:hypothetical protein